MVGGLGFAGSGFGFLISVGYLVMAEGPGSPDILTTLASPSGRGQFVASSAAGILAAILYLIGMVALATALRRVDELATRLITALAAVAAGAFIALLALQYALTEAAKEVDPTAAAFRGLVVESHAFADAAGWTGIALMAITALIASWALRKMGLWTPIWVAGFALAPIWLAVHLLDAGYLFLVPFAAWELGLGAAFLLAPAPEWSATRS